MGRPKLKQEDFIRRGTEKYNGFYRYGKVNLIDSIRKVIIICPSHGEFRQRPSNHLAIGGCLECAHERNGEHKQISQEEFKNRCREKHGNKFNLDKIIYTGMRERIIVGCNSHGEFDIIASVFLKSNGCVKCYNEERSFKNSFERLFRAIHDEYYDYSDVDYKGILTKVSIKCPSHGIFQQTPKEHLRGSGCAKCGIEKNANARRMDVPYFIAKSKLIHGDVYDYGKVNYKNNHTGVIIICKKHGEFTQKPQDHYRGNGCPNCCNSIGENTIARLLVNLNIEFIQQKKYDDCRFVFKLPYDFYLPKYNILIEYDGRQHYEAIDVFGGEQRLLITQRNDTIKTNYAKNKEIPLLRIRFDESIEEKLDEFLMVHL
jgi:hypothetical protein